MIQNTEDLDRNEPEAILTKNNTDDVVPLNTNEQWIEKPFNCSYCDCVGIGVAKDTYPHANIPPLYICPSCGVGNEHRER